VSATDRTNRNSRTVDQAVALLNAIAVKGSITTREEWAELDEVARELQALRERLEVQE
jgi:hypothetical protein